MAKIKRRAISTVLTNVKTVRCFGRDDEFCFLLLDSLDSWMADLEKMAADEF
jgi:hypothetical protein